jgi:hypothetical protein
MLQGKHIERVLITGIVGCGKSTFTMDKAKKHKRLVVWDSTGDYAKKLKIPTFLNVKDLADAMKKDYKKGFKFAFNPVKSLLDININEVEVLDDLCKMMLIMQTDYYEEKSNTKILFVLEEASSTCPPETNLDKDGKFIRFFIKKGRHYGIDFYCVDQSITEVHKVITKNITEYCLFKQPDMHYSYLSSILKSQKYAKIATEQPNFHYIYKKNSDFTEGRTTK